MPSGPAQTPGSGASHQRQLARGFRLFKHAHAINRALGFDTREHGRDQTNTLPRGELAPCQILQLQRFERFRHAKLRPDIRCRLRHHRMQKSHGDTQRFGGCVERVVKLLALCIAGSLGKLPRRLLHDKAVDAGEHGPDGFEAFGKLEGVEAADHRLDGAASRRSQGMISRKRGSGNDAVAILLNHGQRNARDVAEAVGQLVVEAVDERIEAEGPVLSENNFAQEEVAQRFNPHDFLNRAGAHDVAARFAHFLVLKNQQAVGENFLRQREVARH